MTTDSNSAKAYPIFMGFLPSEFSQKLETELHETTEIRKDAIQQIRRLLQNENGINDEWFNDDVIVMYLRGRKYRVHETFTAIKKMVAFVRKHKHYFEPLDPDVLLKSWESDYIRVSPVLNKNGCAVVNIKLGKWNPSEVGINCTINYTVLTFLHLMNDPMIQVNGFVLLYDFKDTFSLRYLRYATPSIFKMLYHLIMECVPIRLKGAHGLNPNIITSAFSSAILSMLTEKIRKRLFVHDDVKNILEHVESNAIPFEYGGKLRSQEMKNHWPKMISPPDYVLSILKSKKNQ